MLFQSIQELLTKAPPTLPVVIPSYNNPTYLKMMVDQLSDKKIVDIIIIDNNSTIEGMSELLDSMGKNFYVVKKKTNEGPKEFYKNSAMYSWLPRWFVITDPDIGFNEDMPDDFLEKMKEISNELNMFRVGFALDLETEGKENNLKEIIFRRSGTTMHEWELRFWRDKVGETESGDAIYYAPIDTTFCLIDKKKDKRKYYEPSVRVAGRFTAQHYGWYKSPPIPEFENEFYLSSIPYQWSENGNALRQKRDREKDK